MEKHPILCLTCSAPLSPWPCRDPHCTGPESPAHDYDYCEKCAMVKLMDYINAEKE